MDSEEPPYDIEVEVVLTASDEQVYDAWLDPALTQQWFGPGRGETEAVEIDSRIGGKFRIVQVRDGVPVRHSGRYLVLERPTHLAFTWRVDTDEGYDEVHIYLTPTHDGTLVRLVHTIDAVWKEYADRIRESWESMLREMDHLLD